MNITTKNEHEDRTKLKSDFTFYLVSFLVLLVITCQFASDEYLPSLPAITHYFSTQASLSQLTITAYLIGLSFSQIFYGILSDRFGRRIMLIYGLLIFFIGSIIALFSTNTNIYVFMSARLIQGAGIGATLALMRPILCDCFSGTKLAQIGSYFGTIVSITPALAPIAGGFIQVHFGWQGNFILLALIALCILIVAIKYFPETNQQLNPRALQLQILKTNFFQLVTSKIFIGYTFCAGLGLSGVIAYSEISPYLFQNILKLSASTYGLLALFTSISLAIGAFFNGKFVKKFSIRPMMIFGTTFTIIAGLIILTMSLNNILTVKTVLIPTMLYFFGIGFIMANAFASAFAPFKHIAGIAGSVYGSLQFFIAFLTSTIVAALPKISQMDLAIIYTGISLIIVLILYLTSNKKTVSATSN